MTVAKPSSEMLERARRFATSNHAYLSEVTYKLLAQFGEELVRETARECAEICSNLGEDPGSYLADQIRQRYNL